MIQKSIYLLLVSGFIYANNRAAEPLSASVEPRGNAVRAFARFEGQMQLLWNSEPGACYGVRRADRLPGAWEPLSFVESSGPLSVFADGDARRERYYQVTKLPTYLVGDLVSWDAVARGGIGPPSYFWEGTDELRRHAWTNALTKKLYLTPGVKSATLVVESGGGLKTTETAAIYVASRIALGTNRVANGDLEDGLYLDPKGWHKGRSGTNRVVFEYPVEGFQSRSAARLSLSERASGDAKWYFDDVAVSPGERLEYSNAYKASAESVVTVRFRKRDGTFTYRDIATLPGATEWTRIVREFSAPSEVETLTVFHLLKTNGVLTVDNAHVVPVRAPQSRGIISLDFDDGWRTTHTNAVPILNRYGFKGTFYIISTRHESVNYIDSNQILEVYRGGHEIGAHSRTHQDLTAMPFDQAYTELRDSRNNLLHLGVGEIRMFAYPFGAYNDAIVKALKELGYYGARSSNGGFNRRGGTDPYVLSRYAVNLDTTLEQVKTWVDRAIEEDTWLILVFHRVDESGTSHSVPPARFDSIIRYLEEKKARVATATEGLTLFSR